MVVVASAGNSGDAAGANGTGQAPYSFPADYPGVLAVAAVNSNDQVSSFSSENLSVQVAAPGDRVPAQGRNGHYWYVSGTSPACALTAGVVALIKAKYPSLTDTQVISAITSSTESGDTPGGRLGQADRIRRRRRRRGTDRGRAPGRRPAARGQAWPRRPISAAASAEIPPVPVAPRGPAGLALYCLLGAACLGLVALSTSRLLSVRELTADGPDESPDGGPARSGVTRLLPPSAASAPARHAAPRGRGHNPAGPS